MSGDQYGSVLLSVFLSCLSSNSWLLLDLPFCAVVGCFHAGGLFAVRDEIANLKSCQPAPPMLGFSQLSLP